MKIEFDPDKSNKNCLNRGLPFSDAEYFDWESAIYSEDSRYEYPERRFVALGYLEGRLHCICYTPIDDGIRVISFRKANLREIRHYEKETANK